MPVVHKRQFSNNAAHYIDALPCCRSPVSRMFTIKRCMVIDAEQGSPSLDNLPKRAFLMKPYHDPKGSTSSLVNVEEKSRTERGPQSSTLGVLASNYPTTPESYELHEVCGQGSTSKVSSCVDARQKLTSYRSARLSSVILASFPVAGVQSYGEAYK